MNYWLDPDLRPVLEAWPSVDLAKVGVTAVREARAAMMAAAPVVETPQTQVASLSAPGPEGAPDVRIVSYRPAKAAASPLPAILHIHGGGYVLGTADMMDLANRLLAPDLECAIFSVDYRLAPETAHPGPVEDCYAALTWLHANAADLGVDPTRIGVKGESAGGGLAAALALLARDRGVTPPLAFQHLIYPMIDDRTCVRSDLAPFLGEHIWTPGHNTFGWSALLGSAPGGPHVSPYAAAARATDIAGLPPTFIAVGGLDLFLEEDLDYAGRLMRAGVPVELHVYPGAFHGFHFAPTARVSQAAERDSREALRRSLHG